jgi:hypothetical protein
LTYNNNSSNNNNVKSRERRCFRCNGPIYFTPKQSETPSGKPTKDPLTGKAIPLEPSTDEYHQCRPEEIESYKQTDEYKNRVSDWQSKQLSGHEVVERSTGNTNLVSDISSKDDEKNDSNRMNLTLEKIQISIDHTNAVLEQIKADYKADIVAIRNALKIDTDRTTTTTADDVLI